MPFHHAFALPNRLEGGQAYRMPLVNRLVAGYRLRTPPSASLMRLLSGGTVSAVLAAAATALAPALAGFTTTLTTLGASGWTPSIARRLLKLD